MCGNPRGREEARDPAAIGTILSPPREARRREPSQRWLSRKMEDASWLHRTADNPFQNHPTVGLAYK